MPSIVRNWFPYPAAADGWTRTQTSGSVFFSIAIDSAVIANCTGTGVLYSFASDTPAWSGAIYFEFTGTWESIFSIPPGSTVESIDGLGYCYEIQQGGAGAGGSGTVGELKIFKDDLSASITVGTQENAYNSGPTTYNPGVSASVPLSMQPSDTAIRIRIPFTCSAPAATSVTFMLSRLSISVSVTLPSEIPKMISLRTGQWNLHREGVAELLKIAGSALCDGTALAVTAEIRLWTSANDPGCADEVADYTEATFSGYAPVLIDPEGPGCPGILEIGVNGDAIGQIVIDQQAWTEGSPATITETINGAYLVIIEGASEFLLGTLLFDSPAAMQNPGDILKVNGFALLDCQMAPVA